MTFEHVGVWTGLDAEQQDEAEDRMCSLCGQVLVQSNKMNLASAVRMAQDFHIIPVYISRQQVANRI
jgi:hypothetical protein